MDSNTSDITICSTALLELGSRPINAFSEDNEPSRLCATLYPIIRDEMLRAHPWNFAKKRVVLSPDTAAPAFGYQYQFTLPADFMRLMDVNETPLVGGVAWPAGYQVENGKILCNENVLRLRYIYRNTNAASWDASFVRLLIAAMRKGLAYAITRDQAASSEAQTEWLLALKQAKAVNGLELPPQEIIGQNFLASRY